jgi:hypothetical protein
MAPHWALVSTSNRAILPHSPPSLSLPERPERGALRLKLRQKGTHGVHMKGVLPRLVYWGLVPVQEICAMPWCCSSQPSTELFFPHRTLFHFIWLHRPAQLGRQSCRIAGLLICVCVLYIYSIQYLHTLCAYV